MQQQIMMKMYAVFSDMIFLCMHLGRQWTKLKHVVGVSDFEDKLKHAAADHVEDVCCFSDMIFLCMHLGHQWTKPRAWFCLYQWLP
jgi:hypothetical protein